MTHDFNILGEEEKIYIDDNLILYIMETLEWIDTFYFLKTREKRKGLNYYGNVYFEGNNVKKLKRVLFYWKELFGEARDEFEIASDFEIIKTYDLDKDKYIKQKLNKNEVIEDLEKLIYLCERAERENKIIEHWGI